MKTKTIRPYSRRILIDELLVRLAALSTICIFMMAACNNTSKNQNHMEHTHKHVVPVSENHEYQVELSTQPQTPDAGSPAELVFAFKENGKTADLEIAHEMKVHLMVISEDLTWFRHIHPEERQDGTYAAEETFPYGGQYLLFTDFKPKGAAPIVNKKNIQVNGTPKTTKTGLATKWVSNVDGYTLTLENGNDFRTNQNQSVAVVI